MIPHLRRLAFLLLVLAAGGTVADSLWTEESAATLYADRRATKIGDIITIIVQENNSTAKDSTTSTTKQAGTDASISSFLFSPGASSLMTKGGKLPALKYDSKSDFSGGGSIKNSDSIAARIAVRVVDVLPNKDLVIEGTRSTSFSGETSHAVLRGVVRRDDVSPANTVYSYNIADATITFVSKGVVSDNQRRGWFTTFWQKLTPF